MSHEKKGEADFRAPAELGGQENEVISSTGSCAVLLLWLVAGLLQGGMWRQ